MSLTAHSEGVTGTLQEHAEAARSVEHPDLEETLAQIDVLVRSPQLHGSGALCKLLQYLAHHTLQAPAVHLKEYQIATEVFGRPADFNPQSDASVRVQVGRLRNKLAEYYSSAGVDDLILVDIPRGRYTLSFERRAALSNSVAPPAIAEIQMQSPRTRLSLNRRWLVTAAVLLVCLLLAAVPFFHYLHARAAAAPVKPGNAALNVSTALQTFWSPFLHGPDKPFLVYSNAIFAGSAVSGMHYYRPGKDVNVPVTQHYTGTGEVMGVVELDRLFHELGGQARIKRSGLFTLDDAQKNNLVFVGSPMENTTLAHMPSTHEFEFRWRTDKPNQTEEIVVDHHPAPGEAASYKPTAPELSEGTDYSVIALAHGLDSARWTLILAGASTVGTQAAVDYVCNQNSMEELLRRLQIKSGDSLKPFEALLQVKFANDVPLETKLVTLRQSGN